MFRAGWANSVFSCTLGFFCGQPPSAIVDAHQIRHHGKLGTEADFVRPSVACFRWNWLNVAVFPVLAIAEMYRAKIRGPANPRPVSRQALAERIIFYGGIATLFIARPGSTALFLFVPWLFGQFCIVGINIVQHQGCDLASAKNHSRNVTGTAINWLMLNGGFHTAHHLRPGLHWSRLPEWHRREVAPHADPSLQCRSLAGAILERMRAPAQEESGSPKEEAP
jgi:fatty acid desaturase